jgi:hypothetical protein
VVNSQAADTSALDRQIRLHLFGQTAGTARVPQAPEISAAMGLSIADVEASLLRLAGSRVLILAPNSTTIWAPNPFCAVPSEMQVEALGRSYWALCIWDALGIPAALHADATVRAACGDCAGEMVLEIRDGALSGAAGIVHFGVPAQHWWDNIAYT